MRILQIGSLSAAGWFLLLGLGQAGMEKKWVKDVQVSSQQVLGSGQGVRIVGMNAAKTMDVVRTILRRDLNMTLAEYQKAQQTQTAKTTENTLLPEKVSGSEQVALADKEYFFLLEVKWQDLGNKTKLQLKASPVYAVDTNQKAIQQKPAIEIKVQGNPGDVVRMGEIVIVPTGYSAAPAGQTLPDAAERAAKLVRAFMYHLDRKMAEPSHNLAAKGIAQTQGGGK